MTTKSIEAVILAGGKGSRLRPFTENMPKALVPVGGRPIIEILLLQLRKAGVRRVHIAVGHMSHLITAVLGNGSDMGLDIRYSNEDEPLSTVGPLTLIDNLPENFLVLNGDILTDLNITALYEHHLNNDAKLTVAAHRRTEKIDYGVIEVAPDGHITGFREKPGYDFTVSMGIYVFSRSVLDHLPKGERFGFDDLMLKLLEEKEPISAYLYDGYWLDIGRPDDYEIANHDIARIEGLLG